LTFFLAPTADRNAVTFGMEMCREPGTDATLLFVSAEVVNSRSETLPFHR
jgi:hypothetical protein